MFLLAPKYALIIEIALSIVVQAPSIILSLLSHTLILMGVSTALSMLAISFNIPSNSSNIMNFEAKMRNCNNR